MFIIDTTAFEKYINMKFNISTWNLNAKGKHFKQKHIFLINRKRGGVWISHMTKAPIPIENSKARWQHKNATNTSIIQHLQSVG